MYTTEACAAIRHQPTLFLKHLKNGHDVQHFILSFIQKDGEHAYYSGPLLNKKDFSASERETLERCLSECKAQALSEEKGKPVAYITHRLLEEWESA